MCRACPDPESDLRREERWTPDSIVSEPASRIGLSMRSVRGRRTPVSALQPIPSRNADSRVRVPCPSRPWVKAPSPVESDGASTFP